MTENALSDEERDLIVGHFRTTAPLVKSLAESIGRLSSILPLSAEAFSDLDDDEKTITDAFILRFSKVQDIIGRVLFRDVLNYELTEVPVAMIDIISAMEKRWVLEKAETWFKLRKARNAFSHSYPDWPGPAAQALNDAHALAPKLVEVFDRTRRYLAELGLSELDSIGPIAPPPPTT